MPSTGRVDQPKVLRTGRRLTGPATLPSRSRQEARQAIQAAEGSQVADGAQDPS